MDKHIDVSVIQRLKNGDEQALEEIYQYYKGPLYYYSLTILHNSFDAEEVVQDVICIVKDKINQLRNQESFQYWLFSIAKNVCMAKLRKKERIVQLDDDYNLEEIIESTESPKKDFDNSTLMSAILASFQKLSPTYKETAELRFLAGLSMKEVADKLNIEPKLVKSRLYEIRQKLTSDLEEQGYSPEKYYSYNAGPFLYGRMNEEYQKTHITGTVELRDSSLFQAILQVFSNVEKFSLIISCILTSILLLPLLSGVTIIDTDGISYENYVNEKKVSKEFEYNNPNLASKVANIHKTIKEVRYHQEPIAGPIEVRIYLLAKYDNEKVQIQFDNKYLNYTINENFVSFYAYENGIYMVQIGEEKRNFNIHNIDNDIPTITSVSSTSLGVDFNMNESKNDIDYEKSFVKYNNKQIAFPKNKRLIGISKGTIEVVLYDEKGNVNSFKFYI